jgi:hypothetical protein
MIPRYHSQRDSRRVCSGWLALGGSRSASQPLNLSLPNVMSSARAADQLRTTTFVDTSSFVGRNPTGELITSGLLIRPRSAAGSSGDFNFPR